MDAATRQDRVGAGSDRHGRRPGSERCDASSVTSQTRVPSAERAHCRLRLEGAPLVRATVQTVARQSPAPSRRSAGVTVWLSPILCIAPNLTGLTVAEAEASAAHASCTLNIEG